MRIMSVIGALALASLCFAFPVAAASPGDAMNRDVVAHQVAPDAPALGSLDTGDLFAIEAIATAAADSPIRAVSPEHTGFDPLISPDAIRGTDGFTSHRRHDPGWLAS